MKCIFVQTQGPRYALHQEIDKLRPVIVLMEFNQVVKDEEKGAQNAGL